MSDGFVYRDGSRLSPYMAYQIERLNADVKSIFGVEIKVSSGIRLAQEQIDIFLERYVTIGNVRGRKVYDTRVWRGTRYYRISSAGTVAVPSTSNHEVQGNRAAVDLRDTGSDAGITSKNSARGRWIRANAWEYGLVASGDEFGEGWHFDILNIWNAVPGGATQAPKDIEVKAYNFADAQARSKGRVLHPGSNFWLHTAPDAPSHNATNIAGAVGQYSITLHAYGTGEPGDTVELQLFRDNVNDATPGSPHFVEKLEIGEDGTFQRNITFQLAVPSGIAVYARASASGKNRQAVTVSLLDADSFCFLA